MQNEPADPSTTSRTPTADAADQETGAGGPVLGETSADLSADSLDKADTPPDWSIPPKM